MKNVIKISALMLSMCVYGTSLGDVVSKIIFKGLQRVDESSIKDCLKVHPGQEFTQKDLDETLKALFKKDFFSYVGFVRDGNTLIIKCDEKKMINKVGFEGNDAASSDVLKTVINGRIGEGRLFSNHVIKDILSDFRLMYKTLGYHSAQITPKIIKHGGNTVDVVFEFKEGLKTTVKKVVFIGNKYFNDDQLKDTMSVKEERLWRFWDFDSHVFREDRVENDIEAITKLYRNNGFPFVVVKINAPETSFDKKSHFCTIFVEEGARYKMGDISFDSKVKKVATKDFKKYLIVEKGQFYNAGLIEAVREILAAQIAAKEHPFTDVAMKVSFDKEKRTVSVEYTVVERPKAFVERIDIVGNTRTLDRVIRREFAIHEGDAYNIQKIKNAIERLKDTDYFEDVQLTEAIGSAPDKRILTVSVKEKDATAQFRFGLNVSDSDGFGGFVGFREDNLMGTGKTLSANVEWMQRYYGGNIDIFDPKFMDQNFGAGMRLGASSYNRKHVDNSVLKSIYGGPYIYYAINKNLSHEIDFSVAHTSKKWWNRANHKTYNKVPDTVNKTILMKDEFGTYTSGELTSTLTFSQSTNIRDPREGYEVSMSNSYSGLMGNVKFWKHEFTGNYHRPITDRVTFVTTARIGFMHEIKGTRSGHRYSLGSDGKLRGFDWCGVGPRDKENNTVGGIKYWSVSFMAKTPLSSKEVGINGVAFLDLGSAWGSKKYKKEDLQDSRAMRASVGVAIEWVKCPLGMPIAFIVGFPIKKKSFDRKQVLTLDGVM